MPTATPKLKNKVALVTGSSRGIGAAIALRFASEGADVIVNFVRNRQAAMGVADEIERLGSASMAVQADVADPDDRARLVHEALNQFGRIDILVNNAGILLRTQFDQATEEIWDQTMNTNLKGMFYLTQIVSGSMTERRSGTIINIASQSGVVAQRSNIEDGISKAGVIYLTRSLARVLAPFNINVNAISPGRVSTDMTGYDRDPIKRQRREREIPLGRINEPDDIAHVAVFLASEAGRNITGLIVAVDGGSALFR